MTSNGAAGGLFFVVFGFVFVLGILSVILLIVALVDMARRPDWQWKLAGQEKVLWILLVCLVNVFAIPSLIYWFSIRQKLIAVEQAAAAGQYGPGYVGVGGWQPGPAPASPWPPGWYPDPSGQHERRWWDGARWSEETHDPQPSPPSS